LTEHIIDRTYPALL